MADSGQQTERLTLLLIAGISGIVAVAFWPLAEAFLAAATFAILLMPLHRILSHRVPAWLSAGLLTAVPVAALGGVLAILLDLLMRNGDELLRMLQIIASWIGAGVGRYLDPGATGMALNVHAWLDEMVAGSGQSLMSAFAQIPLMVVEIIVFVLVLYIALLGGDQVFREIVAILPERSQRGVLALSATVSETLSSIFARQVAVAVVTFIVAIPFFAVLGYGDPLFYAYLAAMLQLVPVVGPLILIVFLAVYALASGDYPALLLLVFVGCPLLAAVPRYLVRSVLPGKRVALHPALVLIGFIGGIGVMGVIGVVLGPLFIVLLVSGYRALVGELKSDRGADSEAAVNRGDVVRSPIDT